MICGQHCGNLAKTILIRTKIADNLFCATVHFIFFSQGVSVLLVTVYEGRKKNNTRAQFICHSYRDSGHEKPDLLISTTMKYESAKKKATLIHRLQKCFFNY
jgi:hypothetical protein